MVLIARMCVYCLWSTCVHDPVSFVCGVFLFSVGRDEEQSEYCMVSTYTVSFVWTAVYAELVVIFCVMVNHTVVG